MESQVQEVTGVLDPDSPLDPSTDFISKIV